MTTSNDKNKWHNRLKTADNAYINELLNNFGLSGGPSIKDLPWAGLAGLGAMGLKSKLDERKERREQESNVDDNKNVENFSADMSQMRDILNQRKTDKINTRNHPSVPGFQPDTRSPYGVFDVESGGYTGGPAPDNITDISEHPNFNSVSQGKEQRGRPFNREEE